MPLKRALLLTLLLTPLPAWAETDCKLELLADLPVTWQDGGPVITASINGQPVHLLLDTGSDTSYLTTAAFSRLNLHDLLHTTGSYVDFMGGTEQINSATMQDIKLGGMTVTGEIMGLLSKAPLDGVLGYDVLGSFDIALDLGHNDVRLFSRESCDTAQYPWAGQYAPVTLEHHNGLTPALTVQVDDQNLQTELDTGADQSLLSGPALRQAGVKPESVAGSDKGADMAGNAVPVRNEQFTSYAVGGEEFPDAWVQVDETPQTDPDVPLTGLLGEDYLSTHKVFISVSTETLLLGVAGQ